MLEGALRGLVRGATRGPLTPKHGNKNYYKGTGSGRMGHWTKHGQYVVEEWRMRQYIVPDLTGFELKPYVSPKADDGFRKSHSLVDYFAQENLPASFSPELADACKVSAEETLGRLRSPRRRAQHLLEQQQLLQQLHNQQLQARKQLATTSTSTSNSTSSKPSTRTSSKPAARAASAAASAQA
ncbi:mitochondrial ribosomal protein L27-domain-containing protein [Entophlyctis helioformis]|nr:mitochondrial ribosomal protein L27-domain-containing protein [Entophlyctis helioformis]